MQEELFLEESIELKEEETDNGVWLHYIGKGLYTIESFVREAKKYGVSRAIPLQMLKKLNWGDKIYLAQSLSKVETDAKNEVVAKVFGYFRVESVQLSASDKLKSEVYGDERVRAKVVDSGGYTVQRACGSYEVGSIAVTNANLSTVAEVIKEKENELGEKAKVFVCGELVLIEPIEITAPFTRSLVRVNIDESKLVVKKTLKIESKREKAVVHVKDYKRRLRLNKTEKLKLLNRSLEEFGLGG